MTIKFKTSIEAPSVGDIIDLDFKSAYNTYYHVITYSSDGDVSAINIWTDDTKATQLFSKTFTYSGGNLTRIDITDGSGTTLLTKLFVYDADGNIETITRTYA
jgi:hypothetical protein